MVLTSEVDTVSVAGKSEKIEAPLHPFQMNSSSADIRNYQNKKKNENENVIVLQSRKNSYYAL